MIQRGRILYKDLNSRRGGGGRRIGIILEAGFHKRNFLNLSVCVYKNLIANITLDSEILELSHEIRTETGMLSCNHFYSTLS